MGDNGKKRSHLPLHGAAVSGLSNIGSGRIGTGRETMKNGSICTSVHQQDIMRWLMVYGFSGPAGYDALIEALRTALTAAREGDMLREEEMTEQIRDASYEMEPRQAGYLVRSACGAIDAAMRAFDRENGFALAEQAIENVKDILWRSQAMPSAM
ncbi:hypothetical protein [Celeribacter halophilus]|nr:hypothetical protein [Celeribacter halophilus]